ncbi:MAG: hypothetical protein GY828_03200 [Candidatus Gracilibacteria bacterium]|nr:hypothetical protein [Candidatus Gracilibacteria bacterium]
MFWAKNSETKADIFTQQVKYLSDQLGQELDPALLKVIPLRSAWVYKGKEIEEIDIG